MFFVVLQPDRLVANDFIQCRKVAEHILDKLLGEGSAGSPGAGDGDNSSTINNGTSVEQIELTCNDQVFPQKKNNFNNFFVFLLGVGSFHGFEDCQTFHMEIIGGFDFILQID